MSHVPPAHKHKSPRRRLYANQFYDHVSLCQAPIKSGFLRFGLCLLVFFLAPYLYGQTTGEITGGAGFELNTISLTDVAGGPVLYCGYNLSPRFVLGLKIGTYSDIREMNSVEGAAFFRWYFHKLGTLPFERSFDPLPRCAFFAQAGAGAGAYGAFIDPPETRASVLGEAAAGLRIYFLQDKAPVFFEPYVRYAYPSGFGVGFTFGG